MSLARRIGAAAALALVLGGSGPSQAAYFVADFMTFPTPTPDPSRRYGPRDFAGRWGPARDVDAVPRPDGYLAAKEVLQKIDDYLQPWAAAEHRRFAKLNDDEGKLQWTPENHCLPYWMPGERNEDRLPHEIRTTPKVWLLGGGQDWRLIHIDAQHPAKLRPRWLGHSVGHWEGDTLVVDTVGFNAFTTLEDGVRHTEALHMTARYTLHAEGRLMQILYTYEDPGSTVRPLKFVHLLARIPGESIGQEGVCSQNNKSY